MQQTKTLNTLNTEQNYATSMRSLAQSPRIKLSFSGAFPTLKVNNVSYNCEPSAEFIVSSTNKNFMPYKRSSGQKHTAPAMLNINEVENVS